MTVRVAIVPVHVIRDDQNNVRAIGTFLRARNIDGKDRDQRDCEDLYLEVVCHVFLVDMNHTPKRNWELRESLLRIRKETTRSSGSGGGYDSLPRIARRKDS